MKITFLMPPYSSKPVGGMMVVYEYANQLVARGHEVTVVHRRRPAGSHHPLARLYLWLTGRVRKPRDCILMPGVPWYPGDSRVKILVVRELRASYIPDGDAIFNNPEVDEYPEGKGKEFVLVQGYRPGGPSEQARIDARHGSPRHYVAVSQWLYEKRLELGVRADEMIHIPNGIDHAKYRLVQPIENRPARIATLYHSSPLKGANDGIRALELARGKFPTLQAVLFGTFPRPKGLPQWIEYHCDPPQEELVGGIYNGSSIYLCPSLREGWHLPPAEAMACGCAVVSTDIGGVRDYAEHGVTALLSPPRNPEALAENIVRLLEDDDLRIRLAKAGHERIQEFTWERSTDLLEQFIRDRIRRPSGPEKV